MQLANTLGEEHFMKVLYYYEFFMKKTLTANFMRQKDWLNFLLCLEP